jgi:hypothetical protein
MTCVHRIMLKGLHFTLISLDEFIIIQIIHFYRNISKVQKCMKEYQMKSYNLIYSPTISNHNYMKNILSNILPQICEMLSLLL